MMKLSALMFRQMLMELDVDRAAACSTWNHHADGLNYLCLHRTPNLTVKLYLMERPDNPNGGFLVHPHSHRYAFWTLALAGRLRHIRFQPSFAEVDELRYMELTFRADEPDPMARANPTGWNGSLLRRDEYVSPGTDYFVHPNEVHTLKMEGHAPILLGLMQFSDVTTSSSLYTPMNVGANFKRPNSRRPIPDEVEHARARCLNLIDWNSYFPPGCV